MTRSCPSRCDRALALSAAIALALAACKEDEEEKNAIASPSRTAGTAAAQSTSRASGFWLSAGDPDTPSAFLARMTGSDPVLVAARFPAVAARYRESPRMVANRVLQLWNDSSGADLPGLLTLLAARGGEDGARQGIGPLVQRYRVLRDRGLAHDAALARAQEHFNR